MRNTYKYQNLSWIDIESPTQEDVSSLIKEYEIRTIVAEELLSPTRKPKIDIYEKYIFLALHFPIRIRENNTSIIVEKEIDFIIGSNFIITTHNGIVEPLHRFAKSFETNSILDKNSIGEHAGAIFYYIMKSLYDNMINDLENIKDSLNKVEDKIFFGHERKMVRALSELSMEIIDFKQTSRMHKEVLESFSLVPETFFGKDFRHFIDEIKASYTSIHDLILFNKELLSDLRETNDSLLSTKQSENLKLFSALAFVTFPLSLLLALFSIPTSHTPIIGYEYDWEILAGTVIVLAISMLTFFKKKGWL
ncbi:MAG TPA: CorA family divalent cation transporter [Candidatus Paceibacterota bacterium]